MLLQPTSVALRNDIGQDRGRRVRRRRHFKVEDSRRRRRGGQAFVALGRRRQRRVGGGLRRRRVRRLVRVDLTKRRHLPATRDRSFVLLLVIMRLVKPEGHSAMDKALA